MTFLEDKLRRTNKIICLVIVYHKGVVPWRMGGYFQSKKQRFFNFN